MQENSVVFEIKGLDYSYVQNYDESSSDEEKIKIFLNTLERR